MLCAGCGQPLTTRAPRGRPARYHNATCRQRAHRARHATHHHNTLDTLTRLEQATSALRHALLTNNDATTPHSQIVNATAELTQQLEHTAPLPPSTAPVTKPVTTPHPATDPDSASPTGPAPTASGGHTATGQPRTSAGNEPAPHVTKTIDMTASIGPNWTLVQHDGDADASLWHVHHHGHAVGTVRRHYDLATNTRGWEARTSRYQQVPAFGKLAASRRTDRLWRTRDSAAAGIAHHLASIRST